MKARYIPKDSETIQNEATGAVVYLYSLGNNGKVGAIGYSGKRGNHDFHYTFKTRDKADLYISDYLLGLEASAKAKQTRAAARASYRHTLKVGDVLNGSWGYDQTQQEFYEVTRIVTEQTVEIRELAQERTAAEGLHPMAGYTTARSGQYVGEPLKKRVLEGNTIKMKSYLYLWPWDGQKKYESWYA